jgi:hypothetical protein
MPRANHGYMARGRGTRGTLYRRLALAGASEQCDRYEHGSKQDTVCRIGRLQEEQQKSKLRRRLTRGRDGKRVPRICQ